jgi:deazaflavin-dependent oxidoreductase (nitroreductase family)
MLANSVTLAKSEVAMTQDSPARYRKPGWFTRHVFNNAVSLLTRAGVSVWGSRVLEVAGRTSGEPRRTPVNLLSVDDNQYLVSARGTGQWVRNVRAAGGQLDLLLGRRRQHWVATELTDDEKPPVLRAYLRRWKAEVGVFFEGVTADSSDDELRAAGPNHPVFVLRPAS